MTSQSSWITSGPSTNQSWQRETTLHPTERNISDQHFSISCLHSTEWFQKTSFPEDILGDWWFTSWMISVPLIDPHDGSCNDSFWEPIIARRGRPSGKVCFLSSQCQQNHDCIHLDVSSSWPGSSLDGVWATENAAQALDYGSFRSYASSSKWIYPCHFPCPSRMVRASPILKTAMDHRTRDHRTGALTILRLLHPTYQLRHPPFPHR